MKFEPRTILTSVGAAQWASGLHRDVIHERATGSSLFDGYRWVWNIAPDREGELPLLRFWTREIIAPETTRRLSLDQVIKSILPTKRLTYHTGEVETTILSISGQTLMRLREELNGKLATNSSFFPREGLEKFLRTRWLGAATSQLSTLTPQPTRRAA